MNFIAHDLPEEDYCHAKLDSGQYSVVEMKHAFGQHRIQVWYRGPEEQPFNCPDVIGVQF